MQLYPCLAYLGLLGVLGRRDVGELGRRLIFVAAPIPFNAIPFASDEKKSGDCKRVTEVDSSSSRHGREWTGKAWSASWPNSRPRQLIIHVDLETQTYLRHRACVISTFYIPRKSSLLPRPDRRERGLRKRYISIWRHHRTAYATLHPPTSHSDRIINPRPSVTRSGVLNLHGGGGRATGPSTGECIGGISTRRARRPSLRLAYTR